MNSQFLILIRCLTNLGIFHFKVACELLGDSQAPPPSMGGGAWGGN